MDSEEYTFLTTAGSFIRSKWRGSLWNDVKHRCALFGDYAVFTHEETYLQRNNWMYVDIQNKRVEKTVCSGMSNTGNNVLFANNAAFSCRGHDLFVSDLVDVTIRKCEMCMGHIAYAATRDGNHLICADNRESNAYLFDVYALTRVETEFPFIGEKLLSGNSTNIIIEYALIGDRILCVRLYDVRAKDIITHATAKYNAKDYEICVTCEVYTSPMDHVLNLDYTTYPDGCATRDLLDLRNGMTVTHLGPDIGELHLCAIR